MKDNLVPFLLYPKESHFVITVELPSGSNSPGGDLMFGYGWWGFAGSPDDKYDGPNDENGHDAFDEEKDNANQEGENDDGGIKFSASLFV